MNALLAAQVAFCVMVLFVAGLFVRHAEIVARIEVYEEQIVDGQWKDLRRQ